jgi:hypothetical protein
LGQVKVGQIIVLLDMVLPSLYVFHDYDKWVEHWKVEVIHDLCNDGVISDYTALDVRKINNLEGSSCGLI